MLNYWVGEWWFFFLWYFRFLFYFYISLVLYLASGMENIRNWLHFKLWVVCTVLIVLSDAFSIWHCYMQVSVYIGRFAVPGLWHYIVCVQDDMDRRIRELNNELESANRKCEVYRANLLSVLKDIEDHKQQLSIKVQNIKISMKDGL